MHLFYVVAAVLIAFAGYLAYRYFENKKNPASQGSSASAFAKIALADVKQKEAEGKLLAIKTVADAKQTAVDALKASALEGHAALDEVHAGLDEVHAILG